MIRRRRAAVLVAIAMAGLPAGIGIAAPSKRPVTMTGSVAVPNTRSPATFEAARCARVSGGANAQGMLGHVFTLPARAYDYRWFTIRAVNPALAVQSAAGVTTTGPIFDVAFYGASLGSCATLGSPIETFYGRNGHTVGQVPGGARHALVVRSDLDPHSLPVTPCYTLPPVCIGSSAGARASASSSPGPEPFTFVIAAG